VTYPALPPQPFPVNNQDSDNEDTVFEDPPPEYSTLPRPSEVDYPPTYIPPPAVNEAPALQPAENANSDVRTVRKRPSRIEMVPKVIHVPQFVSAEERGTLSLPAGNVTMEVQGMSEATVSTINSLFEVGVATISIIGAIFALVFNWREKRRVERAQEREQERFEEWQPQGMIPSDETFVPSDAVMRRPRKKGLSERSHSRQWHLELLD